jgi:hypothetical protein
VRFLLSVIPVACDDVEEDWDHFCQALLANQVLYQLPLQIQISWLFVDLL